jgi:hypothetical protein
MYSTYRGREKERERERERESEGERIYAHIYIEFRKERTIISFEKNDC